VRRNSCPDHTGTTAQIRRNTHCTAKLPRTPDIDARRYQVVDLVRGGRYVTEWRRHEVGCDRCGACTRAEYDPAEIPFSPFGPQLVAVVVLLTGAYHLSRWQTARLLRELFGIAISVGSISNLERRASTALAAPAEEAYREVEAAAVKHADATTWLLAGTTLSLWTFASKAATVYRVFRDGARETIRTLFGRLIGVLVSDRASVFGFWAMAFRQVCWAHLLRRWVGFSERAGPAGAFGRELVQCAVLVFEYWHAFRDGHLTRTELQAWLRPVQRHLHALLQRAVAAGIARLSKSCANVLLHGVALWTFVTHEGVPPTNNHAELELRAAVLWRKRSYGCQSERGLRFVERVMTVVHTARKQSVDVLDFLVRCVTADRTRTTPPALLAAVGPA
jgi:transposase